MKRLPRSIFDYIDGGADDELGQTYNVESLEDVRLIPRVLAGVEGIDTSCHLLGQRLGLPVFCAPAATPKMFHSEGELAVAKAMSRFSSMFGVSALSNFDIETIRAHSDAISYFQMFYHLDNALNLKLLEYASHSGINIAMLTVDLVANGNRERDLKNGFSSPVRLSPTTLLSFAAHPRWVWDYYSNGQLQLPILDRFSPESHGAKHTSSRYFESMLKKAVDWDDVKRLRDAWPGKFVLKGILSLQDAIRAVECGCDGIVVSNHGGRQLSGGVSPLHALMEISSEVGKEIEIIYDSGIRRGTHILKALSLGAKAVMIGRPYLFALAAGGEKGVCKLFENLQSEIERNMLLMGKSSLDKLGNEDIAWSRSAIYAALGNNAVESC